MLGSSPRAEDAPLVRSHFDADKLSIVAETYYLGLMLALTSVFVRIPHAGLVRRFQPLPPWVAAALVASLACSYGLQVHLLGEAAASTATQDWQRLLPLSFFPLDRRFDTGTFPSVATIVLVLSAFNSLCLCGLYVAVATLDESPRLISAICVCGVVILAIESLTSAFGGPDIYAYIGLGQTSFPYHPTNAALPFPDAPISRIWGHPLLPSPYGPLWNAIAHVISNSSTHLGQQALSFRFLGFFAMLASVGALLVERRFTAAALFALNPALWQLYVVEAHNDIVGVALILIAFACRRNAVLSLGFVALAGMVKLPFLLMGVLVFASETSVRKRLALATSGVLAGTGLSLLFGGRAYVGAMRDIAMRSAHSISPYLYSFHLALALLALLAVISAIVKRRFFWGASFSFVALGQYPAAQYLGWAIPYALNDETQGALYLISLPLAAYMGSFVFPATPLLTIGCDALFFVLLLTLALRIRKSVAYVG